MNSWQWWVFSAGFFFFSWFLFAMASGWAFCSPEITGCAVARYSYGIPACILMLLTVLFAVCGCLEK